MQSQKVGKATEESLRDEQFAVITKSYFTFFISQKKKGLTLVILQ